MDRLLSRSLSLRGRVSWEYELGGIHTPCRTHRGRDHPSSRYRCNATGTEGTGFNLIPAQRRPLHDARVIDTTFSAGAGVIIFPHSFGISTKARAADGTSPGLESRLIRDQQNEIMERNGFQIHSTMPRTADSGVSHDAFWMSHWAAAWKKIRISATNSSECLQDQTSPLC